MRRGTANLVPMAHRDDDLARNPRTRYEIVDHDGKRDSDVAALILAIQRDDVGLAIPEEEQPELLDIGDAYRDGKFWVAIAAGELVGTVGMMQYGSRGVLKKLFVR